MALRVGINGLAASGASLTAPFRSATPNGEIEVVALNDLTDAKTNAHLLKYDSNYGPYKGGDVSYEDKDIVVGGKRSLCLPRKTPPRSPGTRKAWTWSWKAPAFSPTPPKPSRIANTASRKSSFPPPAKNEDLTIVLGVNDDMYDPAKHHVISNASCTTNGLAPVAKILNDRFGIQKGLLTTIHAYTNSQRTVDTAAKDLRDARAAAQNIVPSSTGAAKAVGLVIPASKASSPAWPSASRPRPSRRGLYCPAGPRRDD